MERFPWHPRLRHARIARRLVIAAVTALTLAVVAAAGMAATNRSTAAPSNTQPPVVSGTTEVGKNLTTTNGTWSGTTPLSFRYRWRRCDKTGGSCANISDATDNTYTLQGADGGHTLRAVVSAKNKDGTDDATSVPTGVITTPPPVSNNGCPANKSLKTAPIADLAPPARTQIVAFDVLSGPINEQTQSFTMKVRVGSTCGVDIKGASVYVTAVPYNQFSIPPEELTGDDGTTTLVFRRDANFPASSKQQQLTLFIRATKPGEDPLAGVSTRRLVAVNFGS
jgi:hypothetical protein